jgi:hypothetical protein
VRQTADKRQTLHFDVGSAAILCRIFDKERQMTAAQTRGVLPGTRVYNPQKSQPTRQNWGVVPTMRVMNPRSFWTAQRLLRLFGQGGRFLYLGPALVRALPLPKLGSIVVCLFGAVNGRSAPLHFCH